MPKLVNFKQTPEFPKLEEEILHFWDEHKTFQKSVDERSADKSYVFYDGPPFATGLPHYGHILASTVKDVVPRYWTMKGYRVERVWGWDCHGLPIENMIEGELELKGGKKGIEAFGIDKFNAACRSAILRFDKDWEVIIRRIGRWVDFKNSYKTMDKNYMESVWWGFAELAKKGLVYEGRKVILYCPRCSTPLSNFEIAMDNSYKDFTDRGTTYKYKVKGQKDTFLLAWSTTPWNKLATPALAVNPVLEYVKVQQGNEFYILAKTTLKMLKEEKYEVVDQFTGQELERFEFELHFDFYPNRTENERVGVIIADSFVTAEEGTGIVTLAVYGEDDYRVMKEHHVQLVEHVDEEGKLKPEVTPWAGKYIIKADPLVNEELTQRELIYKDEPYTHSLPTCYRCGTRLYYAPLPAWFINVQSLRKQLVDQNEHINWFPNHLKHGRFLKGLENAPDWNISRSRYWGTPMPIWQELMDSGKPGKQYRVVGSLGELKKWAVDPKQVEKLSDIHREFLDDIEVWVDDAKSVKGKRVSEVFDCWVESGSMPYAALHYPFENKDRFEKNYPAQFITEYIAQTRAWFYCMHVLSVGLFEKPSFQNALTTGTILAEDGSKMSKSKKNYPDPMLLINKYGVDSLRLYLMSSVVMKADNLNFSEKEVDDLRKKVFVIWWNVFSFYQSFAQHSADVTKAPENVTDVMDRWVLSKLQTLTAQVSKSMEEYDVVRASRYLIEFVSDLSNWYLRQSRDRVKSEDNKETSQVFGHVLYTLAQLFAPFTPFFSEIIHHNMISDTSSIHLTEWPAMQPSLQSSQLEEEMDHIRKIVELAHGARREKGVKVRQPLATITVHSPVTTPADDVLAVLLQEINVKNAVWKKGETLSVELDFTVTPELKAEGDAREIMRNIQNMRKDAGVNVDDFVKVQLQTWPVEWEEQIKLKTKVRELVKGEEAKLLL
jgi:isoleucyl-tRNA synthetase